MKRKKLLSLLKEPFNIFIQWRIHSKLYLALGYYFQTSRMKLSALFSGAKQRVVVFNDIEEFWIP